MEVRALCSHHTAMLAVLFEGGWGAWGGCNLLRRLHMACGEFRTILLPLWRTEGSHSVRRAKTLVHFQRPWWHTFSLTRRYDCQSAPSVQRGNSAGDKDLRTLSHYEVSSKQDCSFYVVRHQIPRPDSCQSCPYLRARKQEHTRTALPSSCSQIFVFWI